MPYELLVRARFEAAHHLTAYRGRPEPVHGHSWQIEVRIASAELGPEDYAVDFVEIKAKLDALVARFHHADVNTVPPFDRVSPTTERLAQWFHGELSSWLADHRSVGGAPGARVSSVTLWEGPDCSATFLGNST
jgi:6-pyruvoyltetrahydropterin/6-carboxytetrahydropterin synthase